MAKGVAYRTKIGPDVGTLVMIIITSKACTRLVVEGKAPVDRQAAEDMAEHSVWRQASVESFPRDAHDQTKWRAVGWCKAISATSRTSA